MGPQAGSPPAGAPSAANGLAGAGRSGSRGSDRRRVWKLVAGLRRGRQHATRRCNGNCASLWPPVQGPVTAGPRITGKLGTITRSDGSAQATYNGHPLYAYIGDTTPGQANGNGLNSSGGIWHEVTASGAAPAASSGGGGSGY